MFERLRHIFMIPLLVVALVGLGAFAAYASGQAPAVGQTELCSGKGVVIVHYDADGNIVTVDPGCPDCVMDHLTAVDLVPALQDQAHRVLSVRYDHVSASAMHLMLIAASARDPPMSV